ncbi:hypothetical protein NEOLEDRAFT_1043173, partial [Neolentinus lepideus HHB14362 ss-1]
LRWTPGHEGIKGNELADTEAKKAAEGDTSAPNLLPQVLRRKSLPISTSALKQAYRTRIKRQWQTEWKQSPRYERTKNIDRKLPS